MSTLVAEPFEFALDTAFGCDLGDVNYAAGLCWLQCPVGR
ncbi:hypothetical protein JOF56_009700 [Kibdelosporangium banguiense]|uniref:Uncharacterized protein n=1 Tax=Kibdelosporangium banguiense TaxID=1365924 RepID=A0ABS4TZH3_9PSEU|nr:hypothetical protein [Kibdelosporangium banguiense]